MPAQIMDPSTRLHRAAHVAFTRVQADLLGLDEAAGFAYALSGPASRVWELLSEPLTFGALCARLQQEFEVDEKTCQEDVSVLLAKLSASGLVRIEPSPEDAVDS